MIRRYPVRDAGPDEVLVRITMSTICRSDIHSYLGHRPNPYDEATGRYRGLRGGERVDALHDLTDGLLVKSEVAIKQREADQAAAGAGAGASGEGATVSGQTPEGQAGGENGETGEGGATRPPPNTKPGRYYGRVALDAARVGRDAGQIADEVISHLAGLVGSSVTVTLEIEADVPDGVPDNVVRTVTENSRTLKFTAHGFEKE